LWFSLIFYFLGTLARFLGRLVSGLSCSLFHLAPGFLGGTFGGAPSLFDVALCSLLRLIGLGENIPCKSEEERKNAHSAHKKPHG
jgi:hypothetical protein